VFSLSRYSFGPGNWEDWVGEMEKNAGGMKNGGEWYL